MVFLGEAAIAIAEPDQFHSGRIYLLQVGQDVDNVVTDRLDSAEVSLSTLEDDG